MIFWITLSVLAAAIAAAATEAYLRRNRPRRRLSETRPDKLSGWLDLPDHHATLHRPARCETKGPRG